MPHRSHEWPDTLAQLCVAFADPAFKVHGPVPTAFGDEGAANHMRLAGAHGEPGVELFVYGTGGGPFPARQHVEASRAIARRHGLSRDAAMFVQQSAEAIAAGAFHNDVVAVANETVLFAHEQAFADRRVDDGAGALDGLTLFDLAIGAKNHDTDIVGFEVQRHAARAVGELDHLAGLDLVEAIDAGDAVADRQNLADLGDFRLLPEILDLLLEDRGDLSGPNVH